MTEYEQETKDILFKGAENLTSALANLITVFNCSYLLEKTTISNMGITYHNKIVELQRQYKEAGLSYYDSHLVAAITGYTANQVVKGFEHLKELRPLIARTEKFPFLITKKMKEKAATILDEYRACDDKLYEFSIERDIGLAVAFDMMNNLENSQSPYEDPTIIERYREELKSLGLSASALDEFDGEQSPVIPKENIEKPKGPNILKPKNDKTDK